MKNTVTEEKIRKYMEVTAKALEAVRKAEKDASRMKEAEDFLDMATRYYEDAKHFEETGRRVLAFGAVNYAHAWLDAGARLGLFKVKDSNLFTVDDE